MPGHVVGNMNIPMVAVVDPVTGVPPSSSQQALAYDGSGRLSTITVTQGADSYRQTLTYDGAGKLTGVSAWVKL